MKKITTLFSYIILIGLLTQCSGNLENAIAYNDIIVDIYEDIAVKEVELMYTILNNDTLRIDMDYRFFLDQIQKSKSEIEELGAYNGYDDFYKKTLALFKLYEEVAHTKIVDMMAFIPLYYTAPDDTLLNAQLDSMLINMDAQIGKGFEEFETAQQKFAAKHGFALE